LRKLFGLTEQNGRLVEIEKRLNDALQEACRPLPEEN
jgi:hypothetical protein